MWVESSSFTTNVTAVTNKVLGSCADLCGTVVYCMFLLPGYREIVMQSLPQISALDDLDRLGNPSHQGLMSPCDVPGLEDYMDLLLSSDTSHTEAVIFIYTFYAIFLNDSDIWILGIYILEITQNQFLWLFYLNTCHSCHRKMTVLTMSAGLAFILSIHRVSCFIF